MQFMGCLYVADSIGATQYKIIEKVHKSKLVPNLYLIALSANPDNMLDLIPEWEALQKGYPRDELRVVGIATGKKEAVAMVACIVEDAVAHTGHADVRPFLKMKWEEQACR